MDADTKLAGDIANEVADRKSAISAEAKSCSDADLVLDGKISALSGVEATHFAYLEIKIAEEAKSRADADSASSGRIDFLTVHVDSKKMDSLSEIVNRMNSTGADVYLRLSIPASSRLILVQSRFDALRQEAATLKGDSAVCVQSQLQQPSRDCRQQVPLTTIKCALSW